MLWATPISPTSTTVDTGRVKSGSGRCGSISSRIRESFDCSVVRHFLPHTMSSPKSGAPSAPAGIFKLRLFLRCEARKDALLPHLLREAQISGLFPLR